MLHGITLLCSFVSFVDSKINFVPFVYFVEEKELIFSHYASSSEENNQD